MRPVITLLTDFGTADGYVAQMKGVLLAHCPEATLVDVTHEIAPQDIEGARLTIARYWRRFPEATVHVCVVDPAVGSARAALAVAAEGRVLVGPDNGILSPALLMRDARAVALPIPPNAAPTFHGRDVFAPAAARLAMGAALDDVGTPHPDPVLRRTAEALRGPDGAIHGEVLVVDRFGNAMTNLVALWPGGTVEVGGVLVPLLRTYAEAAPGAPLAVIGSSGFVEVAVRNGSAARTLGLARGAKVVLRTDR